MAVGITAAATAGVLPVISDGSSAVAPAFELTLWAWRWLMVTTACCCLTLGTEKTSTWGMMCGRSMTIARFLTVPPLLEGAGLLLPTDPDVSLALQRHRPTLSEGVALSSPLLSPTQETKPRSTPPLLLAAAVEVEQGFADPAGSSTGSSIGGSYWHIRRRAAAIRQ